MSEIELKDCECHGCLKYGQEAHGLTFQNEKVVLDFVADREAGLVAALEHYADHNNYLCEGCKDGSCKGNSYNQIYLPADGETHGYTIAENALKEYRGKR